LILVVLVYYIAYNRVFFLNFREYTWPYFNLPVQYGFPVLFLVALLIKKAIQASRKGGSETD
jgi:ABC-type multidrug transport system permease subunit